MGFMMRWFAQSIVFLSVMLVGQATAHPPTGTSGVATSTLSAADVLAEIKTLPVLSQLASSVTAAPDGTFYTLSVPGVSGVSLTAFKGSANWHAGAGFTTPSLVELSPEIRAQLGTINVNSVAVIVSKGADTVAAASIPPSVASLVTPFTGGGDLALNAGVNVFAVVTPSDDGLVGVLKNGLGLGSGSIKISGSLGAELLYQALAKANVPFASGEPGPTEMHLKLELPRLTPAPFNAINNKAAMHVELDQATVNIDRVAGTLSFGGALAGHVWILNSQIDIPALTLTITRGVDTSTVEIAGAATGNLDPFGIGLPLSSVGLRGTFTTTKTGTTPTATAKAASLAVTAQVNLKSGPVSGEFGLTVSQPATGATRLDEFFVSIPTGIKLTDLGSSFTGDALKDITITAPAVGFKLASREAYIAGGVDWPGRLSAKGVLYARKRTGSTGFALFAQTKNVDLARLVGLTLPVPLTFPDFTFVASTIPLTAVPLGDLPAAAQEIVDEFAASGKVTFKQGLSMLAAIDTSAAPFDSISARIGASGPLVIRGELALSPSPSFTLRVVMPTFTIPAPVGKVLTSATPSVFLALASGALSFGLEGDFGLNVGDGQNLTLRGKLYAALSTTGGALRASGSLVGMWANPFGLTGISVGNVTVGLGITTEGAIDGSLGGTTTIDGKSFTAAGIFSVLLSSGIPTVKGVAIQLKADEIGPLTPLQIGQTFVKASANVLKNAKLDLDATKLDALTKMDVVTSVKNALPLSDVKLTGVELFVCTPGMTNPDFPQFEICGAGFGLKAKGTLRYADTELGSFDGKLTAADGFSIKASTGKNLALGPTVNGSRLLTINNATLDMGAGIPLIHSTSTPYFKLNGSVTTLSTTATVKVDVSLSGLDTELKIKLGTYDDAFLIGFKSTGSVMDPTNLDFRITIKADLAKLRTALASGVKNLLDNGPGKALRDQVAVAQRAVADKQAALASAISQAQADQASAKSAITRAEEELAAFRTRLSTLDSDIARAKSNWQAAANRWDVVKMVEYSAIISGLELGRPTLVGLVQGAEATLVAAKEGATWFPISMYPGVIAATSDLNTAKINLGLVELSVSGLDTVGQAVTAIQNGLTGDISIETIELIDASLKQALLGNPQTLRVTLKFKGKTIPLEQSIYLKLPGNITLTDLFNKLFNATGGQPDQATIDAKMAALDLGFGEVVFYKDLARNGTASWIAGKKIGSPGWNELGFVVGGSSDGKVWGTFPGTKDVVTLTDTKRDGTPGWVGPKKLAALETFINNFGDPRFMFGNSGGMYLIDRDGKLNYLHSGTWTTWPIVRIDADLDGPGVNGKGTHTQFFGGWDYIIYGIKWNGELWCYNTKGPVWYAEDGDTAYGTTVKSGRIGTGWNQFTQVFGGQDGVIYGINAAGQLKFYKHTGQRDCSATWTSTNNGAVIGWSGWQKFRQVIGGADGIMYAIPRRVVPLTPGAQVALWSQSYDRFLRVKDDTSVDASAPAHFGGTLPVGWTWERFKVVDGGNGTIALWNPHHKRFLRMNDRGDMDTTTTSDGSLPAGWSWERFRVVDLGAGRVSLWSDVHQKFVKVIDGDALGGAATPTGLSNMVNGAKPEVFIVSPTQ